MNNIPRKTIYLAATLFVYVLMVVGVLGLLFELELKQLFQAQTTISAAFDGQEKGSSFSGLLAKPKGTSGILLPVGPDDGQLPGGAEVWDVFLRANGVDAGKMDGNGFDGLQGVKNVADFSNGSVAELFLAGTPLQAFRRGRFLLVLNSYGSVQVVDSENPSAPKKSASLPYQHVQHMEMQGDVAFLLLSRLDTQSSRLVVVDLSDPRNPRELTRLNLPEHARFFSFWDRQLVVYSNSRGYKGDRFVHLYDLTDNHQLTFVGRTNTHFLGSGFLKHQQYLLVPDLRSGLHIYDFSNPLQPVLAVSLDLPDRVKRLAGHGDIVFALGFQNVIYAIDLHDPLNPLLSTVVEEANHSAFLIKVGNYLYYLTENGYLEVFDASFLIASSRSKHSTGIVNKLVPTQSGGGLALLEKIPAAQPAAVTDILTLPDKLNVIEKLFWQGELVVLEKDGLIQLFREGKEASLEFKDSLKLPSPQRWLAASNDRLYVGSETMVNVIAKKDDGSLELSGQFEFPGAESWDGLVVQQTLCVAAGKDGVLCFSVESPDRPISSPGWTIPRHLATLVDVRQIDSPGGNRMLVAAGSAGLLSGEVAASGQFQLDGFINFLAPVYTLAVVKDFCLVSTGNGVDVIDVRTRASLQNLGKIAFTGVERLAITGHGFWAGYVPKAGWSVLPVPRLVSPEETELLATGQRTMRSEPLHGRYRLNLYNDQEIITVPGVLTLSALSASQVSGAAHGLQ